MNPTTTSTTPARATEAHTRASRRRMAMATEAPVFSLAVDVGPPRQARYRSAFSSCALSAWYRRHGPARPRVAEAEQDHADQHESEAQQAHVAPPWSSRSRIASPTRAALAWPRVAFMTCPTRNPTACAFPAR